MRNRAQLWSQPSTKSWAIMCVSLVLFRSGAEDDLIGRKRFIRDPGVG